MLHLLRIMLACLLCTAAAFGAEPLSNPQVLIRTSVGNIKLELYPGEAPLTVANFLKYADSGFYNGTMFHRVMVNFMIQGGGFTTDFTEKPHAETIPNESHNHLHNERGTVAMARTEDPDSAAAQFFINVRSNLNLDFGYVTRKPGYAVFGRVIEGMDVVDGISLVVTHSVGQFDNVPENAIVIESVERIE